MLTTWLGNGESEHMKLESLSYLRGGPQAPRVDYSASYARPRRGTTNTAIIGGLFPIFAWQQQPRLLKIHRVWCNYMLLKYSIFTYTLSVQYWR